MLRILTILALGVILASCQEATPLIDIHSNDPQAIAEEIMASALYKETTDGFKEIQSLMLSDVRRGAYQMTDEEVTSFALVKDKAEFLREKGYENAARISELSLKSEAQREELLKAFSEIETKVGSEVFNEAISYIDANAAHTYKLTSEEALSLFR